MSASTAVLAEERRRNPRLARAIEVEIDGLPAPLRLTSRDISEGGVFLFHPHPPPLDLELDLYLRAGDRTLALSGRVVHHLPGIGFGVRFEPPSPAIAAAVTAFVAALEAAGQNEPPTATPPGPTPMPTCPDEGASS
jgi:hypothetical protein